MDQNESNKLWGGRFLQDTNALMERFNASIQFDRRLLDADIEGTMVYVAGLSRIGIMNSDECEQVIACLRTIRDEFSDPDYDLPDSLEDIHMAVEHRLTELLGPLGGKIHAGRSRNDQINIDERLYLRKSISLLQERITTTQHTLIDLASKHIDVLLPGYTHMQQAQPILFAHYILSLFWMLDRDMGRLSDSWKRADVMPLGSGALAGSTIPIDREFLKKEMGFSSVTPNSLDAVSDRDFLIETVSAISILMMHLSRFCEDLIIWSSTEFSFIELSDSFSTGSSMMPQKKNPDSLELIRGKTGRVYGDLVSLLTMMKAVPLAYSKDLQEDKEPLFDAVDTAIICLDVFSGALSTMELNCERMESVVDSGTLATDLADYLVDHGVTFRDAHSIVGKLVRATIDREQSLAELSLEQLQEFSDKFDENSIKLLDVRRSLESRNIEGGTGPDAVRAQLAKAREKL